MKFKEFVALCNKLEFDRPECGEWVIRLEDADVVDNLYMDMLEKEVVVA